MLRGAEPLVVCGATYRRSPFGLEVEDLEGVWWHGSGVLVVFLLGFQLPECRHLEVVLTARASTTVWRGKFSRLVIGRGYRPEAELNVGDGVGNDSEYQQQGTDSCEKVDVDVENLFCSTNLSRSGHAPAPRQAIVSRGRHVTSTALPAAASRLMGQRWIVSKQSTRQGAAPCPGANEWHRYSRKGLFRASSAMSISQPNAETPRQNKLK